MKYYYRQGGYDNYRGKKRGGGGAVAAVLAMVIVFAAGFLIGGVNQWNLFAPGNTSSTESTGVSSGSVSNTTSSGATNSAVLPSDLNYTERPQNGQGTSIGGIETVTGTSYVVIDRLTGAIVLAKNAEQKLYPGATTQIMTAILALEKGQVTDTLTTTSFALGLVGTDSMRLGLQKGETLTLHSALSAMLLGSAADAANVIADQFGYNGFVKDMVTRAKDIGCSGTYFVSPNGTHSTVHFSTVSDLARIEAYAQKNETYRQLALAEQVVLPSNNLHNAEGWQVVIDNDVLAGLRVLLQNNSAIAQVETTYTGVTSQGYTLVSTFVTKGGAQLTAVLGGIPYNKGKGAADCLPQMAALLCEAAKKADAAAATEFVPVGELDNTLTAGVSEALPLGAKLVTEQGFRLLNDANALQNGETAVFGNVTDCTVQITYYKDLPQILKNYQRGTSAEVGYLTVTDANGKPIASNIAVYLQ